jgi:hypothetical protein
MMIVVVVAVAVAMGVTGDSMIRMSVVMSAVNVDDDVQLAIRNGDYRTSTGKNRQLLS